MGYNLAKKLKEAGFEVREKFSYHKNPTNPYEEQGYFLPSLSELIKACNPKVYDDFGLRIGYTENWEAWATYHGETIPEVDLNVSGNTPEEAVATLWLALNKHDN